MNKRFLKAVNVLLGAASVALVGCHTQKNIQDKDHQRPVIVKYGSPAIFAPTVPSQATDSVAPQATDSIQPADMPRHNEGRVMVKYGVPPTRTVSE
ncbi:MAG: hypothetical protein II045_03085 [Oscillospiraceae bacterium]|nr:hypothetical protein [Oscillospiraceae bacterium]MBQ2541660.1 hypothetical protein [Paludibacteraceae bacterium]